MTSLSQDTLASVESIPNDGMEFESSTSTNPIKIVFQPHYDLPVKQVIFGNLILPVHANTLRIKDNQVCFRVQFVTPPDGVEPDRRHCLQIQLSFTHIHKFLLLDSSSNGATALSLAVSDVAVLRVSGALSMAMKKQIQPLPSRRYIFFDLILNSQNEEEAHNLRETLKYIDYGYHLYVEQKLASRKKTMSEKEFSDFEKASYAPYIGYVKKDTLMDLLKFSTVKLELSERENKAPYYTFVIDNDKLAKPSDGNLITIDDISLPTIDKSDIIMQKSASGNIEFHKQDLDLLKPGCWLNDKIVDWYCYKLLSSLPAAQRAKIKLCETYFYTTITKGIENETIPAKMRKTIFENYDPKKFKQNFFDSTFIVVPVHRLHHWFLVVIMNPSAALQAPVTSEDDQPAEPKCYFLIFDSFRKLATNEHDVTFDHLTFFLARHFAAFKGSNLSDFNRGLVMKVFPEEMPQQTNADDCGIYSLMFLKYFFDHLPDGTSLPQFSEWWKTFSSSVEGMRLKIYNEIITTASNYEAIKRKHATIQEPVAKKAKVNQIYRMPYVTQGYTVRHPTSPANIGFRPRQPQAVRILTRPAVTTVFRPAITPKVIRPVQRRPETLAQINSNHVIRPSSAVLISPSTVNETANQSFERMGIEPSDDEKEMES